LTEILELKEELFGLKIGMEKIGWRLGLRLSTLGSTQGVNSSITIPSDEEDRKPNKAD
jgi:hypothetical protein